MTTPFTIDLDKKCIEVESGKPESRIPISSASLPLIVKLIQVIQIEGWEKYKRENKEG